MYADIPSKSVRQRTQPNFNASVRQRRFVFDALRRRQHDLEAAMRDLVRQ
jgi:hypothetical protein